MVNIRMIGMPTARYAHTSCNKRNTINSTLQRRPVAVTYIDPIAVARIEGILLGEQIPNVAEACNLELLRLLFDYLAMEGADQRRRIQQQRAIGQLDVALANRAQVLASGLHLVNKIHV